MKAYLNTLWTDDYLHACLDAIRRILLWFTLQNVFYTGEDVSFGNKEVAKKSKQEPVSMPLWKGF